MYLNDCITHCLNITVDGWKRVNYNDLIKIRNCFDRALSIVSNYGTKCHDNICKIAETKLQEKCINYEKDVVDYSKLSKEELIDLLKSK